MTGQKTWRSIFLVVAGILVGASVGYFISIKRQFKAVSDQTFLAWQNYASQRGAEANLLLLEAVESGRTNDLRRFRLRGRAVLECYVAEVKQIQKKHGYTWCPNDPDMYQRAQKYLANHPRPSWATNSPPEPQK